MQNETSDNYSLPYDVDLGVMDKILDVIKQEKDGLPVSDLFKRVDVKHTSVKSQALKMARFLQLIDSHGQTVRLGTFGVKYFHNPPGKRNEILARAIPAQYKALLTWINWSKEGMTITEIINKAIDSWGAPPGTIKSMMNTFARYADRIGVISYMKGGVGRCIITSVGREVLTGEIVEASTSLPEETRQPSLPSNQTYLSDFNFIRIIAKVNGKDLPAQEFIIESEEDLEQLDAFRKMFARRIQK